MSVEAPYPELDEYLVWIGEAGWRISEIEASVGSASNISVCIGWPVEMRREFALGWPWTSPWQSLSWPGGPWSSLGQAGAARRAAVYGVISQTKKPSWRPYLRGRKGINLSVSLHELRGRKELEL